jgi:hypothetical protein
MGKEMKQEWKALHTPVQIDPAEHSPLLRVPLPVRSSDRGCEREWVGKKKREGKWKRRRRKTWRVETQRKRRETK